MSDQSDQTILKLLKQQKTLSDFGTFAFRAPNLQTVLQEAARVCSASLDVSYSKICRFRPAQNDLLVVAGSGWADGVVGFAISVADESSPQGRAFMTGQPQLSPDIEATNTYKLPSFYQEHGIISTVDVLVAAKTGPPFGVLEVDSVDRNAFDSHDIDFLTGFANTLAEAVATADREANLRRTIAQMEALIEEKEVLSQELKHRVRNNLHLVYGLLTAQLDENHSPTVIDAFRSIAIKVMSLAHVFDHLLGVGMTRDIDFGSYAEALCVNLPVLYNRNDIALTFDLVPLLLELDEATSLGIIITELVSNAYLHAFRDQDVDGEIGLSLSVGPQMATLRVVDNGVGFVEVQSGRRGMTLVRRLVTQIRGVLTLSSGRGIGTTWTLVWPLNPPPPATP